MKNKEKNRWTILLLVLVSMLVCFNLISQPVYADAKTHFDYSHVDLAVGGSYKPKLIKPDGRIIKSSSLTWKSSKTSVVKVSSKGKITGKKAGKAKIFATYKDKTYSISVQVYKFNAAKVKKDLGVPNNVKVKIKKTGEYYWDGAAIWLVGVELYSKEKCVAFADVAVKNSKIARQIYAYNPSGVY
ncbi:Bacterial Ig-like domain (group 2) [uncultured Eubacterium sp.]|nr:Bacterial Ig-like domain (group 2) [uncultured Eubacterium sp.]